jgi:PPK2 family polyphosphate:nucleotide phosphotransferase
MTMPADWFDEFRVRPGSKVRLKDYDTGWSHEDPFKGMDKAAAKERAGTVLAEGIRELAAAQDLLAADDRYAVLVLLQAMDAAGKDGTVKHVMSGMNPQGCQVHSFKRPTPEELDHTFLWRYARCLPERGRIGIFNRSYYEDVLVVKVHPDVLPTRQLPPGTVDKKFWAARYADINAFEEHLVRNGTVVLKFFLHVSKREQKKRLLARLDDPAKHWKFSAADLAERALWADYRKAYEHALSATSTAHAPWYVIPADAKWVTRAAVAAVLAKTIKGLDLCYPTLSAKDEAALAVARKKLEEE